MERQPPVDDQDIVRGVLEGNVGLFEVVMRRYNQQLYRAARSILRTDADAEDAVQQAYLNAYRHLHRFQAKARLSTWLTQIVVNEALARRRRDRGHLMYPVDEHGSAVASSAPDPERRAYIAELRRLLRAAVQALPDGYRSVFMLRAVEGLNTAQTAERLSVTEAAVKTRLHRAKDLLKQNLRCVNVPRSARRCEQCHSSSSRCRGAE